MSDLSNLIQQVIAAKLYGNKEFALFYMADGWVAMIGNPSNAVMLGETYGELATDEHGTAEDAVICLLTLVKAKYK